MSKSEKTNKKSWTPEPIAIIGMGCMFPKADNLGAYWANIKNCVDAITEVPESHWRTSDYYNADPKKQDYTYGTRGGFLSPIEFNPLEYGMPPNAIEATDTAQLLALIAANRALTDAGYGPGRDFNHDRTSVLLGVTGALELTVKLGARLGHPIWKKCLKDAGIGETVAEDVLQRIAESYPQWQENSFPGLLGNVVAGRITKHLDLGGTNCAVDAACASSHSAIHMACMELMSGRSDMVISGGIDAFNDIFMYMCFTKTPALSPSGHAKPFDSECDGTTLGEGLGIVVLKRLVDAERDNDRIYAVIRSMGTSSDGKGEAIYAPSSNGQVKALTDAYNLAGVTPDSIELIEAHGTGTKAGDAAELSALRNVYGDSESGAWCAMGSVKSQIGHTKAAAGVAGLIKATLAVYNKVLPPTAKITKPQEAFTEETCPFYVNTEKRPWLPRNSHPRRAGVSAFGFGGSNFHCLLEEYNTEKSGVDWQGNVEILPFSADSIDDLKKTLATFTPDQPWEKINRQAFNLRESFNTSQEYRLVLAAQENETDLPKLFTSALSMLESKGNEKSWSTPTGIYFSSEPIPGKVAFIFPGQGTQYVGMLNDLACQFPQVLDALRKANDAFAVGNENPNKQLSDFIYALPAFDEETKKQQELELRATRIAPPSVGAVSAGALKILESFGICPDAVAGHSYGELVALYAGGVYDEEAFHRVSKLRGELMGQGDGDRGSMLALRAPLGDVESILEETKLDLVIANKNAPNQVVISGATDEINKAKTIFDDRKIRSIIIPVAAAFHSRFVSHVHDPLLEALKKTDIAKAMIPVYSNVTAEIYPDDADEIREMLAIQLAKPVEFTREIQNMYDAGIRIFVEVGPGARMTGLVKAILKDSDHEAFALDSSTGKRDGILDLARTIAQITALGYPVDLDKWNEGIYEEAPATDSKKPMLTITISGANYVAPKKTRPPVPDRPVTAIPETPSAASVTRPTQSSAPLVPEAPMAPVQPTSQNVSGELADALKATQENMEALQKLQEHTANLHQQFLAGQQSIAQTFQALLGQQQKLFSAGTDNGVPEIVRGAFVPESGVGPKPVLAQVQSAPDKAEEKVEEPVADPDVDSDNQAPAIEAKTSSNTETVLMETISDKTGYPVEMLDLDMALDADLGIDSIKRVEILSALKEKLPDAPEIGPDQLGEIQTLRQIVEFLGETTVEPENSQITPSATAQYESVLLETISEKTGYPVEMLDLDMALDADLGIDSIKRVEILSALKEKLPDAPEIGPDQLGEIQTLRQIVEFLGVSVVEPETSSVTAVASVKTESVLLETISEKTGYPVEMLDLDMALDADLGIDSIKRVEILSALKEKLPDAPEIGPDQLGEIQTLRQIVEHLYKESFTDTTPQDPIEKQQESIEEAKTQSGSIERAVLECIPLTNLNGRDKITVSSNSPIWILEDESGLSVCIKDKLEFLGYSTEIISSNSLDSIEKPSRLSGLIILSPVTDAEDIFLLDAFKLLQFAGSGLRNSGKEEGSVLVTISRMDGQFGLADSETVPNPVSGGLAGITKTASLEWPEVHCKAIDLAGDYADLDEAASNIVSELFISGPIEVGLTTGDRFALQLTSTPASESAKSIPIQEKDVVVITGGARGVTAEVAIAFASTFKPTLVLLGRSRKPHEEPEWLASLTDEAEIKRKIMARANGAITPKRLDQKFKSIRSNREIMDNIARMESCGAKVCYRSVDIRDDDAVHKAISKIRKKHGPVKAIVHGAGVLADKFISDKTAKQFDEVYSTKIKGLRTLLSATQSDDLKVIVMFSSSTARFGRKGQCDYAVANEVLNKIAQSEAKARPDCRIVSVNWGPWSGGMVTPSLAKLFESEGLGLIDLEIGSKYLVDEICSTDDRHVEVVVLGESSQTGSPTHETTPQSSLNIAFELELDTVRYPFLKSHVMNGKAVLPAAMMVEWLAHGAIHSNPGLRFHGLNNLKVFKGVLIDAGKSHKIRVLAGKALEKGGLFLVPVELRGVDDYIIHASAEIVLANSIPKGLANIDETTLVASERNVYGNGHLFHGSDFQGIEEIDDCSKDIVVANAKHAPVPANWTEKPLRNSWLADPLALDCSFQMMILWSFQHYGMGSLPTQLGEYRQFKNAFPKKGVRIQIRVKKHNEHRAVADIEFTNPESKTLIARISDYECVIDGSLQKAFKKNSLK